MKFSALEKASDYEVKEWLKTTLNLTPHQLSKMYREETLRWSDFKFYKYRTKKPVSLLWRLTLPFWVIYWILAVISTGIKWIFTGSTYLPTKFLDKFHRPWAHKLNL